MYQRRLEIMTSSTTIIGRGARGTTARKCHASYPRGRRMYFMRRDYSSYIYPRYRYRAYIYKYVSYTSPPRIPRLSSGTFDLRYTRVWAICRPRWGGGRVADPPGQGGLSVPRNFSGIQSQLDTIWGVQYLGCLIRRNDVCQIAALNGRVPNGLGPNSAYLMSKL